MRKFEMHRDLDVSGVSGAGLVAEGVEFGDGTVVIRWFGEHASTVLWPSVAAAVSVHGHDGATRFVFETQATGHVAPQVGVWGFQYDSGEHAPGTAAR